MSQLGLVTYSDWNKASDFDPLLHNTTLLLPGVADQTMTRGCSLMIALPLVDADGHAVTCTVEIMGDTLSALDVEHGFWSDGESFTNHLEQNKRWMRDNTWHDLLPNGDLYRWEGSFAGSTQIAELGTRNSELTCTTPLPAHGSATRRRHRDGRQPSPDNRSRRRLQRRRTIRVIASDGDTSTMTTFLVAVPTDDEIDAASGAPNAGGLTISTTPSSTDSPIGVGPFSTGC